MLETGNVLFQRRFPVGFGHSQVAIYNSAIKKVNKLYLWCLEANKTN
jgi:hypothetical protein